MPTIQLADPLSAASEAVGSFFKQKRDNVLDAQAQAAQQAQIDAQKANIENARANTALQGKKFEYQQTQDTIANAAAQAKAELDAKKEADTALHQAREDAVKLATEQNTRVRDDRKFALDVAKINQTFKIEQAKLKNARTVAEIHAGATLGAANIHASATIGAANIHAGATITAAGMRIGAGTGAARDSAMYAQAFNSLSPTAAQFYDTLYSTNNPPTRAQAMLALRSAMTSRGKNSMTPQDAKNLEQLILSRDSQFASPANQESSARFDVRNQRADAKAATTAHQRNFTDVTKGKAYLALPPQLRQMIRHVMVDQGLDADTAISALQTAPIPEDQKAAIHHALTGQ